MGKGRLKRILRLYRFEFFDKGEGRPGAWEEGGVLRGKKDAVTALCLIVREEGTTTARYALCSMTKDNKVRAGVMRALMELMVDLGSSISYLVSLVVVAVAEGRVALVEEGGLPVLVEIVEVGMQRQHS